MEPRRRICCVISVQNSSHPLVYAPDHGLCRAARVGLEGVLGMPQLRGRRFVVGEVSRNSFELLELKRIPILTFDARKGMLETCIAHELPNGFSEISIVGMTQRGSDGKRHYNIFRETEIVVVGERTIALEKSGDENCWNPSKHGLQDVADSDDSVLEGGVLLCGSRAVDLSTAPMPGHGGWVTLALDVAGAPACDRIMRWRRSTSIIGSMWRYHDWCYESFKFKAPATKVPARLSSQPHSHERDILWVDFCDQVEGKYSPVPPDWAEAESGLEQVHARGAAVLAFCRPLGCWCLFADLWTLDCHLYQLEHTAADSGLKPCPEGDTQLLYRCVGPSPLGRWEAVLGPEPAPNVRIWKQTTENVPSSTPRTLDQILGFLLDFEEVQWRGYVHQKMLHGLSAAQIGACLLCIINDCCSIRAVSRLYLAAGSRCACHWSSALRSLLQLPTRTRASAVHATCGSVFHTTAPGIRVFSADILRCCMSMLPDESVAQLEQAALAFANLLGTSRRRAVCWRRSLQPLRHAAAALRSTSCSWFTPLAVAEQPSFQERSWAASISAVTVSTRVAGKAKWNCDECKALHRAWASCVRFAHSLLDQVPVCWDREARSNTERQSSQNGVPLETVFAGNLVNTPAALKARCQLLLQSGQLHRRDGVFLDQQALVAFQRMRSSLEKGVGVKFLGCRRGYCSQRLLPGTNRCHWAAFAAETELSDNHDESTCPICSDGRGWSQLHSNLIYTFEYSGLPCAYEYEQRYEHAEPSRISLIVEVSIEAFVVPFLFMSTDRPLQYMEDETTEVSSVNWSHTLTDSNPEDEEQSDDLDDFFDQNANGDADGDEGLFN